MDSSITQHLQPPLHRCCAAAAAAAATKTSTAHFHPPSPLMHVIAQSASLLTQDCDTVVLRPDFASGMLAMLSSHDVAWSYDWPASHRLMSPPPPACTCVFAFESNDHKSHRLLMHTRAHV